MPNDFTEPTAPTYSGQPTRLAPSGDRAPINSALLPKDIPPLNPTDPASLEAWHGPFGFFDHYRKVVLSDMREIVRAKASVEGMKVTEARIDDLARVSDGYREFLAEHLDAREQRWKNVFSSGGG